MRVLVHDQGYLGHHLHYFKYILPPLADLVDEVVVTIPAAGVDTPEYRALLQPLADRVDIRPVLGKSQQDRRTMTRQDRLDLAEEIRSAVRRFRPDYILVPTADFSTTGLTALRLLGRGGLPGGIPGEAGIHIGLKEIGRKNRLKDDLYLWTQRLSPWRKVHYINFLTYERVLAQGGSLARRARLLAHPVSASPRHPKEEGRRRLGLPEDGRYIGLVAEIDERKAIPELLAAFRSVAGPDDHLLLAGRLVPQFVRLIEEEYSDLVEKRAVILMNHFIDIPTSDLVHGALDVVIAPYPKFNHLSSAMLHGVEAGKPVLVNDFGWMRAMVRMFGFGWACDVMDPAAFASTLRQAFDECEGYRETEATRRLLAFHAPENFAQQWLVGIRETMGLPPSEGIKTWSWVLEALQPELQPS